ncbi:MAG: alpha/beta hydrolase [Thermoleophilia bacterium]|nr:alpha/beta hydrolase [Thermoleophilia bacterium]
MTTVTAEPTACPHMAAAPSAKSHIGLVVLAAIASGLSLGLVLVLAVFAGGREHEITGAALFALGSGFVLLAVGSTRFTDQPQRWAHAPGVAAAVAGLAIWLFSPSEHVLALAGWVWPVLLLVLVGWSFRGARRSLHTRARPALLHPALVVLLLVAVGGAYETIARATSSNPPLGGRTYLVNGHRLFLNCVGEGAPAVVLFNGQGERTPSWAWIQRTVSSSTRVCAFDRAGEGWSGGAVARDARQLTSDVQGLLAAAHVPGPYVLAGHSVGGIHALLYAKHHPEQVAGLALLDSSTPYQFDLPDYPAFYSMWRRGSALFPSLARAGLARATFGRLASPGLPPRARRSARAFAASPREIRADQADFAQLPRLFDEAKAVKSLGGSPLAVVTAAVGNQRGWRAAQDRLAKLSTNSVQRTVAGATHAALLEDERFAAITTRAITQVVRHVRSGRR